jgi:hypothetical protein
LPDISPGTARNIPSWNQLTGLSPAESKAGSKFPIRTIIASAPRTDAGTELVSESLTPKSEHFAAISPNAPGSESQTSRIKKKTQSETSDDSLLSDLLSNYEQHQSSRLRFPFNKCFALSLPRQDIENCVHIQYSLSTRHLIMQNRDLLDRLQMKRLEIRALSREISGTATHLKYEENLFAGNNNAASRDPSAANNFNLLEMLEWLKGDDQSKENDMVSGNHEFRDNHGLAGRGNPDTYTHSNLWNFWQTMVDNVSPLLVERC